MTRGGILFLFAGRGGNYQMGIAFSIMRDKIAHNLKRIQEQIDTSPIYQEKGMVTRGIFRARTRGTSW